MFHNVYIAGAEAQSGKSLVVLGMMEMLRAMTSKVGFFRPVIKENGGRDPLIHLILNRYELNMASDELYGCTQDVAQEMISNGRSSELVKLIIAKYKALTKKMDMVVCAGTDFSGAHASLELAFNIQLANHFDCLLIPVVNAYERSAQEIAEAARILEKYLNEEHCNLLATFVNRTPPTEVDQLRALLHDTSHPFYILPERALLQKPTVGDISRSLGLECLYGNVESMNNAAACYKIAAMQLQDVLPRLEDCSLIITPGDRSDIILGALASDQSRNSASISGIVLTGNQRPAPSISRLLDGMDNLHIPILLSHKDTFDTAVSISEVQCNILPSDDRKIATALGLMESSTDIQQLRDLIINNHNQRMTPLMFEYELIQRAKTQRKHIVLPEGTEERILRAAELLSLRDVVDITLLGDLDKIHEKINLYGLKLNKVNMIDPRKSEWRQSFADTYRELRKHKNVTDSLAYDTMSDVSYFGTMMVHMGYADGMVSGSVHTTQHTIRPAFEIIKTKPGCSLVSSVFIMCLEDRVLVYGDCAVNPNPNAAQLADIAISAAETSQMLGIEPRIAMLSYSTGESGKGDDVEMVREGAHIAQAARPDLKIEGPIQYDAAVDPGVAESKMPGSEVAGKATVFIFPDLNTGNNTYKAVQRSARAVAIGPILQGLNKPVNDLSRGCTVTDIVNTVVISAIQAQTEDVM
ncbi:MAG: Phosphate acetyltransferase (EC [uncultured Thiotrichaceae bacterium]|uniref:Phosphate acetyltransferase n=1 Tax=uncultured Thiotrichaceae bacterium TaxID=298394 RepID=A0A6S6U3W6_9GAMM|nr:MAG: Phosphate acetyltransferase (EC [uncultured Thiotrichaceae bacterium]